MRYKIGDTAWYAGQEMEIDYLLCPDCFGKKYLTVIKGDGEQVTIDCAGCGPGYEPPSGYVKISKSFVSVKTVTIDRLEETTSGIEYGFRGCYRVPEDELFETKEQAEIRAAELVEEHNKKEIERINRKEKENRTWAWNVHYHGNCIKQAEKDLAYHRAKLDIAKIKAKKSEAEG